MTYRIPRKGEPEDWLNSRQTAALLYVHLNTLKRIPASELPYWTIGPRRDRRYGREEIEAYIERRMVR